jgi:hypothetical protein
VRIRRTNIRILDTGVVHEHAMSSVQQARCGQFFLREPLDWPSDGRLPFARDTEAEVDCMACIVTPETEHADLQEIIIANSVKDPLEAAIEALMGKVIA